MRIEGISEVEVGKVSREFGEMYCWSISQFIALLYPLQTLSYLLYPRLAFGTFDIFLFLVFG